MMVVLKFKATGILVYKYSLFQQKNYLPVENSFKKQDISKIKEKTFFFFKYMIMVSEN